MTPPVLWEAALLASALNRNDLVLGCLDRFESLQPGRPWVGYYRALALLNLRRANEAVEAIETEAQRVQAASMSGFHVVSVRATIAAELKNADAVREQLRLALATPLREVTNLTPNGIATCLGRLWAASQVLDEHDDLRRPLEDRLLASGLVNEALWRHYRARAPMTPKLSHFRVTLRQPLDDGWATSPSALPGQESWTSYRVTYGVLAAAEERAKETALSWQARALRCRRTWIRVRATTVNTPTDRESPAGSIRSLNRSTQRGRFAPQRRIQPRRREGREDRREGIHVPRRQGAMNAKHEMEISGLPFTQQRQTPWREGKREEEIRIVAHSFASVFAPFAASRLYSGWGQPPALCAFSLRGRICRCLWSSGFRAQGSAFGGRSTCAMRSE